MADERVEEIVEIEEQSEEVTEQEDVDDTTETKSAASGISSLDDLMLEGMSEAERDKHKRMSTPTPSLDGQEPSTPSTPRSCSATPPLRSSRSAAAASANSTAKAMKFPFRQSISWIVGSRIEAKDFMDKWYPARIHEIDEDDQTVLIHFEGWNARYDEWIKMTSERLRPATRHSGRKETSKPRLGFKPSSSTEPGVGQAMKGVKIGKRGTKDHKVGECVFAKWTDCRLYAARIISINTNGSYDVLFYDGYRKTVQPINVKTMTAEVQKEYGNLGLLPPPLRKGRYNKGQGQSQGQSQGQEEVKEKERSREEKPRERGRERERPQAIPDRSPSTDSAEESKPYLEEYKKTSPSSTGSGGTKRKRSSGSAASKKSRTDSARSSLDSRESLDGKDEALLPSTLKLETTAETPSAKEPPLPQEVGGTSSTQISPSLPGTLETVVAPISASSAQQEMGVMASSGEQPKSELVAVPSVSFTPSAATPDVKLPPLPGTSEATVEQYSPLGDATRGLPIGEHIPLQTEVAVDHEGKVLDKVWAPKEFKITDDHNQFKCPWDHCGKGFRKLTLLEYHMKYYHTDDGGPLPPPPSRRRKKTLSTCSTDSEISVGGRSTGSRPARRKRDSAASISIGSLPDTPLDVSVVTGAGDDSMVGDNAEDPQGVVSQDEGREGVEDTTATTSTWTPNKDEVVNCICQLNEENGLMIQCDVCLCWQHASCMGLNKDNLPKKYVCYICANPPGVRDSARYLCNQDWHRDGTLASFNFLPSSTVDNAQIVMATHHLVGDVHNIQYCLNGLRQKLFALKDKSHPELHFWQKNWDREMERQREEQAAFSHPEPGTSQRALDEVMDAKVTEIKDEPIDVESRDEPTVSFFLGEPEAEVKSEIKSEPVAEPMETELIVDEPKSESVRSNNTTIESEQKSGDQVKRELNSTQNNNSSLATIHTASSALSDISQMSTQSAPAPPVAGTSTDSDLKMSASATELHDYSLVQGKEQGAIPTGKRTSGFDSTEELESDVSVVTQEEDPFANCEKNLLEHIMNTQDRIEARLDAVEEQVAALEALEEDPNLTGGDILGDIPALRRNIHQLMLDLNNVKRMARYH